MSALEIIDGDTIERTSIPTWTLGDRLRKSREAAGFKRQEDIARVLHVSRATVAGWEGDNHEPSWLALDKWAAITCVPLAWLSDDDSEGAA